MEQNFRCYSSNTGINKKIINVNCDQRFGSLEQIISSLRVIFNDCLTTCPGHSRLGYRLSL